MVTTAPRPGVSRAFVIHYVPAARLALFLAMMLCVALLTAPVANDGVPRAVFVICLALVGRVWDLGRGEPIGVVCVSPPRFALSLSEISTSSYS